MVRLIPLFLCALAISSCASVRPSINTIALLPDRIEDLGSTSVFPSTSVDTFQSVSQMDFSGLGEKNTEAFYASGNLKVSWTVERDCFYSATLEATNGDLVRSQKEIMTAMNSGTGSNFVYAVEPGDYYIKMITGASPMCPWTITLATP